MLLLLGSRLVNTSKVKDFDVNRVGLFKSKSHSTWKLVLGTTNDNLL
jgi:hypothetical protein